MCLVVTFLLVYYLHICNPNIMPIMRIVSSIITIPCPNTKAPQDRLPGWPTKERLFKINNNAGSILHRSWLLDIHLLEKLFSIRFLISRFVFYSHFKREYWVMLTRFCRIIWTFCSTYALSASHFNHRHHWMLVLVVSLFLFTWESYRSPEQAWVECRVDSMRRTHPFPWYDTWPTRPKHSARRHERVLVIVGPIHLNQRMYRLTQP